jgi:6-phosphogluconolactonase (cycloisomerase 2 family)
MSENFTSARWVAQVTGTDNRTLGISNRTVNSFKIYSRLNDGSMALTDSSGIMVVVWGYYV